MPPDNKPLPEPVWPEYLPPYGANSSQRDKTEKSKFTKSWHWRRALMVSLISTRINGWVNNGEAGELRRHRAHYDVTVMSSTITVCYYLYSGLQAFLVKCKIYCSLQSCFQKRHPISIYIILVCIFDKMHLFLWKWETVVLFLVSVFFFWFVEVIRHVRLWYHI